MTDQYPEDEMHAPEWMTKKFFEDILRTSEKDDSIEVRFSNSFLYPDSRRANLIFSR